MLTRVLTGLRKARAGILGGLIAGMVLAGAVTVDLQAQGPFSAQIQAALRVFLATPHTWTAAQTHTGVILAPNGTTGAPAYSFSGDSTQGWRRINSQAISYGTNNSTFTLNAANSFAMVSSGGAFAFSGGDPAVTGADTGISKTGAASIAIGNGTQGDFSGTIRAATYISTGEFQAGTNFLAPTGGAFYWSGKTILKSPADGIFTSTNQAGTIGSEIKADALPTATSCGTSPSVTAGSTPFAGSVNVGTGGVAAACTVVFGGTAYPSAPFCLVTNGTASTVTTMTAVGSATTLNINSSVAWPASSIVNWICVSAK